MAFINDNPDAMESSKQHLNLSEYAMRVVNNDMFAFGEEKLSAFINRVFGFYYPVANASVSRRVNEFADALEHTFAVKYARMDEEVKRRVVEILTKKEADELMEKAAVSEKGQSFKFWLNSENFEYLTERSSECGEEKYYDRRGLYIKAVMEEYALLPFHERELVYYTPYVESIKEAIKENKRLRVVTDKDKVLSIYPYRIFQDPLATTSYLIGYSKRYDFEDDEKKECSLKISQLKSVRVERSKSGFLKDAEKKSIEKNLNSKGVQFMTGREETVKVRLSEAGEYKYKRLVHLRPSFEKREGSVFTFNTTLAQAEFYFFKFGCDAEILEPEELRDKFRKMYLDGATNYLL